MACVHFMHNSDTCYLTRSHAFFGAKCIHVTCSAQTYKLIPCSLYDHAKSIQHDATDDGLSITENSNYQVIFTETDEA